MTALFELNPPELPDSSTCKQSLQVAEVTVGMTAPGALGPSLVVAIDETKYRFSERPARRLHLDYKGHRYTELHGADAEMGTPIDAPFRRWIAGLDPEDPRSTPNHGEETT